MFAFAVGSLRGYCDTHTVVSRITACKRERTVMCVSLCVGGGGLGGGCLADQSASSSQPSHTIHGTDDERL